ncbi:MAG: chemotaxis-specific protein-glutamate methyltransferase CheB [Ignavibacteriae bacterium]|nr:chemotaxis-specific protein-glutamate methyltransferase CheB [Ignavibacteriota bacterium]
MKKIRVLVADNSVFIRQQITKMLSGRDDITVIGGASNGSEAVVKVLDLLPSVVLMNCQLPLVSGVEALIKIKELTGIPVIMMIINRKKSQNDEAEAFENGASECIVQKSAFVSSDVMTIKDELINKIKSVCNEFTVVHKNPQVKIEIEQNQKESVKIPDVSNETLTIPEILKHIHPDIHNLKIVVIGVSTGGPMALHQLIPKLPSNFPIPIIIVQHMPAYFTASLAKRLNEMSHVSVKEASDGMKLLPGTVLIAQGGKHIQITKKHTIHLSDDDFNVIYKPSIDVLVNSIVEVYGGNALGVMMTGMGSDGTYAFKKLHQAGGYIIAQDEKTSIVFGMPKAVIDANIVSEIHPLEDLASAISACVGLRAIEARDSRYSLNIE